MFGDVHSYILLDVAANLGSAFFSDERSEAADVNILTLGQGFFDLLEHGFERYQNIYFWNARLF